MRDYLTLAEIAATTGTTVRQLRRLAAVNGWRRRATYSGHRGRPAYRYRVADVLDTILAT